MALSDLARVAVCLLVLSATLRAQDPFGTGDPFADPFAAKEKPAKATAAAQKRSGKETQKPQPAAKKAEAKKVTAHAPGMSTCERIRASLDDETFVSFIELPLADALQTISEMHDVPIIVDRRSLEEVGLTPDTPISIALSNVTLRSVLRLMLRELELTYMIRDQVLQITTRERAEQDLEVRFYKLPGVLADKSDEVIKAMQTTVLTDLWETVGGPCTAAVVDHVIVVSGTEELHEEVSDFLEQLAAALE